MNMFKKNGGFTLVELIVVIAILAILAGVAVPTYSGYINKANEAADYAQLDSLKTAAVFAAVEEDDDHQFDVKKIVVTSNSVTVYDSEADGANSIAVTDLIKDYAKFPMTFKTNGKTGATWTASEGWELN